MNADLCSKLSFLGMACGRGWPEIQFIAKLLLLVIVAAASSASRGETLAIQNAAGQNNNFSGDNRVLGWIFSAKQNLVVQKLGIWDQAADGLLASHQVGIWTSTGALLGSTTVLSGTASPLIGPAVSGGQFRYAAVTAIPLSAGQTYVVGGLFNGDDEFIFDATSVTAAPEISYLTERYSDTGTGFVFPTDTSNRIGLFGTNFTYTVPEPAGIILAVSAMLASAVLRRRF